MSGGRFDYKQFYITEIADNIEGILIEQGKEIPRSELWGDKEYYEKYPEEKFHYTYPEHIQEKFKEAVKVLRIAHVYAQRIDWYLSGDDGDENFIRRLSEELKELEKLNSNNL